MIKEGDNVQFTGDFPEWVSKTIKNIMSDTLKTSEVYTILTLESGWCQLKENISLYRYWYPISMFRLLSLKQKYGLR